MFIRIEEHHVVRDRRLCSGSSSSSGWAGWWVEGCDEKKTFKKHWQFVRAAAPATTIGHAQYSRQTPPPVVYIYVAISLM